MSREAGKGSSPRPYSVPKEEYDKNWNRIFNRAKKPVSARLVNPLNKEEWFCEDYSKVDYIDGVEYIKVHKYNNDRTFLMRKDALRKI